MLKFLPLLLLFGCAGVQSAATTSVLKTRPPTGSCYEFSYEGQYDGPPPGLDIVGVRRCNVSDRAQLAKCTPMSIAEVEGGRLTVWTCL